MGRNLEVHTLECAGPRASVGQSLASVDSNSVYKGYTAFPPSETVGNNKSEIVGKPRVRGVYSRVGVIDRWGDRNATLRINNKARYGLAHDSFESHSEGGY